jgi:hypothetical protein
MEIAAGPAERGPWRQNESQYDYVDDPTVAITAAGDVFVAWVDQVRKDMFLTRVPASASSPDKPVNVSRTPATFSWLPRIALHPTDSRQVFLLWQEIIFSGGSHGGDILYARSTDHATTFSDPVNLSRSVGGDGKGRTAVWILPRALGARCTPCGPSTTGRFGSRAPRTAKRSCDRCNSPVGVARSRHEGHRSPFGTRKCM